jgi:hypothetical protein
MPKTTHNYQNDSDTSEQSEQITLLAEVEGILEALADELHEVATGGQIPPGRAILGLAGIDLAISSLRECILLQCMDASDEEADADES